MAESCCTILGLGQMPCCAQNGVYCECLVLNLLLGSHRVSLVQLSGVLTVALVPLRAQHEVSDRYLQASSFLLQTAAIIISGQYESPRVGPTGEL